MCYDNFDLIRVNETTTAKECYKNIYFCITHYNVHRLTSCTIYNVELY